MSENIKITKNDLRKAAFRNSDAQAASVRQDEEKRFSRYRAGRAAYIGFMRSFSGSLESYDWGRFYDENASAYIQKDKWETIAAEVIAYVSRCESKKSRNAW